MLHPYEKYMLSLTGAITLRTSWQAAGLRCVLTNGVFDLLHAGHVGYLEQARGLGDRLVVALNSDHSVRAIKGPLRPIVPEQERAALLAALRCVDAVVLFAEPTAEAVIAALRPDIYVKGGDYGLADGTIDTQRLPEALVVQSYGGQVELLPYAEGLSTSTLIQRIVERYSRE
jgi:D-glycero-beta-D-manno-heptose 1-phosphate adenylyltransferase